MNTILIIVSMLVLGVIVLKSKGYKISHLFSPDRWKAVYRWLLQSQLKALYPEENNNINLTSNELLQLANRVYMCEDCVLNGKCIHCQCDIGGAMSDKNLSCSDGKWGPMLSEDEMEELKKEGKYNFKNKQI